MYCKDCEVSLTKINPEFRSKADGWINEHWFPSENWKWFIVALGIPRSPRNTRLAKAVAFSFNLIRKHGKNWQRKQAVTITIISRDSRKINCFGAVITLIKVRIELMRLIG